MIYTGPKFLSSLSALMTVTLGSRSKIKNFRNVKVFVKVFKTSLFPNLNTELIHFWFDENFAQCNPPHPTPGHVQPGQEWGGERRGLGLSLWVCPGVVVVVSTGYQEEMEGMLAASFSVGLTVLLQGKVLSVSDYCPTAVSFAAVAAVVAVAWLRSLPLT